METDKDHFLSAKIALQKAISKKKKFFFQEKIGKNANNSKELSLKNDGAIQLEPTRKANIFKDLYSDLAGDIVRKLPHLTNLTIV